MWGYDMRRDSEVEWSAFGEYTTRLLADEAARVIDEHADANASRPLLLYVPHLAVHSANAAWPLQAPPETLRRFGRIRDESRRHYAGDSRDTNCFVLIFFVMS